MNMTVPEPQLEQHQHAWPVLPATAPRYIGWRVPWYLWTTGGLMALVAVRVRAPWLLHGRSWVIVVLAVVVVLLIAAVLWEIPPAVTFCGALALTMFSGNWGALGLPGFPFLPDRFLLVMMLAAVFLRSPGAANLPPLRIKTVHLVMLITVLYAAASAVLAGTIAHQSSIFALLDRLGALPFLMLLIAPTVFPGARERTWLLAALVGIGAYLGATSVFETVGPHSLVFPHYIRAQDVIRGTGQAVGPFNSVVTEGFACYTCAIAATIATFQWRGPRRWFAGSVVCLTVFGSFLSLERAVWIGTMAGSLAVLLMAREARRFLVPVVVAVGIGVLTMVTVFPSIGTAANNRYNNQEPVWDRKNQTAAALRMIEAKPLFGFGWNNYSATSTDYFRQARGYPLTGYPSPYARDTSSPASHKRYVNTGVVSGALHDTYLSNAVELGLVGASLWLTAVLWGLGGAIFTNGDPKLRPWRLGLLGMVVCFLVIAAFDPLNQNFTELIVWTWAGVAVAGASPRSTAKGQSS